MVVQFVPTGPVRFLGLGVVQSWRLGYASLSLYVVLLYLPEVLRVWVLGVLLLLSDYSQDLWSV